MTLPWAARQFIKLLPVAFVPSRHTVIYYRVSTHSLPDWMQSPASRFVIFHMLAADTGQRGSVKDIRVLLTRERFHRLMYQTRYPAVCFEAWGTFAKTPLCLGTEPQRTLKVLGFSRFLYGYSRRSSQRAAVYYAHSRDLAREK